MLVRIVTFVKSLGSHLKSNTRCVFKGNENRSESFVATDFCWYLCDEMSMMPSTQVQFQGKYTRRHSIFWVPKFHSRLRLQDNKMAKWTTEEKCSSLDAYKKETHLNQVLNFTD